MSRLTLLAIDVPTARRIQAKTPGPDDVWADDYPFEGDLAAIGGFLKASERCGEQRPFGYYQIVRTSDGVVVGGIGFRGHPVAGTVEIGYGLAPSARGQGYAAEALIALMALAAGNGARRLIADTTPDNIASQRTLLRAGFGLTGRDGDPSDDDPSDDERLWHYAAELAVDLAGPPVEVSGVV
jgi:RimJ/RimL family protein N-acetyltransferase